MEIEGEGTYLVPVNRLLGFLFAQHTCFDDILALLHGEPLPMTCCNQRCVNPTHISLGDDRSTEELGIVLWDFMLVPLSDDSAEDVDSDGSDGGASTRRRGQTSVTENLPNAFLRLLSAASLANGFIACSPQPR